MATALCWLALDDRTLALVIAHLGSNAAKLARLTCKALQRRLRHQLVCLHGRLPYASLHFNFFLSKATVACASPLMSSFVLEEDEAPTIRAHDFFETWAFVLLAHKLQDGEMEVKWPAFPVAAWPALPLIHKWDAAPLLPLVREAIRKHPTARSVRMLEKYYGDEVEWSHAEVSSAFAFCQWSTHVLHGMHSSCVTCAAHLPTP